MAGDRWGEHSWVFVKDLYSRPLGAPKGPVAEPKHNVFTRSFAHLDVRLEVDCPHIPRNCSHLTWHILKSDDDGRSLTGNWTVNITQPKGIQHIEVWQTGTQLYIRTDTWGATPSTGTVDLNAMTATVKMVGGASEVARIERNFSFLAFPACPSNCWCKFPHCPMPEPAHWKPYPPVAPPPPPLAVPPYPALAPPFPQTWSLNRSTIIHTSNLSGWTDTASAGKYGIVSFDVSGGAFSTRALSLANRKASRLQWNNAKAIWLKPNRESTCEATLVEQARRVKAASPATKVLVYRNCMYALQWLESERAVMYDPAHADFFLRDKSGAIYNAPAKEGDQYLWNYSNPAAARYKMDVVIGGEGGVGAPGGLIDGIFLDDPGPNTATRQMAEYVHNIRADAKDMSAAELQTLATDTYGPLRNRSVAHPFLLAAFHSRFIGGQ